MKRLKTTLLRPILPWLVVGLIACIKPARSDDAAQEAPDMGTIWASHWSRHQLGQTMALYTADAIFFTLDDRFSGTAALRTLFRETLDRYKPTIQIHRTFSEQSGNLAHESGDYEETLFSSGQPKNVHGHYLIVLRRETGRWLIVEQMWTGTNVP